MSSPRIVRYLLTLDRDGDELVWAQYSSGKVSATSLSFVDVQDSGREVLDLTGAGL